jgi:membrane protease YdiL (CAAX protease family)
MVDSTPAVIDVAPVAAHAGLPADEKRHRWFELNLVLLIACGGGIVNALFLLHNGPTATLGSSSLRWSYGIVHEFSVLALLAYVLSRRGLGFKSLGFGWSIRDVGVGLLVTGVSLAAYFLGSTLIQLFHHAAYGSFAKGPGGREFFAHPSVVFIPFVILNPFFEELVVRAYLMSEVFALTGSRARAILTSVVVQSSYHLYYGWAGAISLSFLFLTFALYYMRSRRALPIIVAHGLFDLYALFRVW